MSVDRIPEAPRALPRRRLPVVSRVLAAMRWSERRAAVQPSADIGLVIGFVFVAAFFVISDTHGRRGSKAR